MTLRITQAIGLCRFSPRWLRVLCLRRLKKKIERSLGKVLSDIDVSHFTPEEVRELRERIDNIHLASGKGIQA
ncbi:TPA: hypothetical protein JG904_004383 [Enterobacter hormaechei subsp. xiangfangensis]|nr:hypothetical protein [Enterobacter hormaechei subsp. xiangfangensis]